MMKRQPKPEPIVLIMMIIHKKKKTIQHVCFLNNLHIIKPVVVHVDNLCWLRKMMH